MSDAHDSIMRGLAEVESHLKGESTPGAVVHNADKINVTAIRKHEEQSPVKLADQVGTSKRTLEN